MSSTSALEASIQAVSPVSIFMSLLPLSLGECESVCGRSSLAKGCFNDRSPAFLAGDGVLRRCELLKHASEFVAVRSIPGMRVRLPRPRSDRPVVVCGSDSLALRLVEELTRTDEPVTVVVDDAGGALPRRMVKLGARVVEGPASEVRTLRAAGVATARALALVSDDDVGNIHAALAAQDLNPRLRLVVRMFNVRLGQRIDNLFDDCTVLSASTIAAPFFVDAALGDGGGQLIRIAGRQLVAGPPEAVRDVLAPLSAPGPGGARALLPDDAARATLVLGTPRDPDTGDGAATPPVGTVADPPAVRAGRRARRRRTGRAATLKAIARALISQRLRLMTGVLAVLVGVATLVFHAGVPKLGWIDAFYFTVTTFTSTGNADLAELGASPQMKVFGAFLMLLGVLTIAVLTAVVVDDLVGARLAHTLGAPVGHPEKHVVVCGLGTVGLRVAEQLRAAGVDVVGVERDPDPATYATARRIGIPLVRGDASEEEALRAAGVATARCVVAVTDDDVANLEAGLASRTLRADLRVVLRLFDSDLADRVGRRLDLSISRSVSMAAAPVFAAAMMGREVIAAVPAGRRVLLVAEAPVSAGSVLAGAPIEEIDSAGMTRVIGHVRGGDVHWRPECETPIAAGDSLLVVATRAGLSRTLVLTGAGADTPAPEPAG
jgi:Trk K+ transport system NAD-binding subunit